MSAIVLIASADSLLVDDLLRLAAAADVETRLAADPAGARAAWRDAALVVVGADLAGDLARSSPERRPGVILTTVETDGDDVYRFAVEIGAQQVVALPGAETWLVDQMAAAGEPAGGRPWSASWVGAAGRARASWPRHWPASPPGPAFARCSSTGIRSAAASTWSWARRGRPGPGGPTTPTGRGG
ncbi:hypothetical protein GCM10029978_002360 [Actinoallomurus acanthiterrae]